MVSLPALTPTSTDFTAPEYPVKSQTSLSGVVSRRLFGNRGSRSTLRLSYTNIPDSEAAKFLTAWRSTNGQVQPVTVPAQTFEGAGAALTSYLADGGDGLTWHFAEPPGVQRVFPGISTVSVSLEATRDA